MRRTARGHHVLLVLLLGGLPVSAAAQNEAPAPVEAPAEKQGPPPVPPEDLSPFLAGELIVKFTEEAAKAIEEARAANQLPAVEDPVLTELLAKYGVTAIESVVTPIRSLRAPPGSAPPDFSRTYKLTFDPSYDILEVLREFAMDSHVEYAEPSYSAMIVLPEDFAAPPR